MKDHLKGIICIIIAAAVGQFAITSAYKFAPAKKLSVFDYVQVLFAALWGILFFRETPTVLSITGYVIIIGVALIRWEKARIEDRKLKNEA